MRRALRVGLAAAATGIAFAVVALLARSSERAQPEPRQVPLQSTDRATSNQPSKPAATRNDAPAPATPDAALDTERSSEQALMAEAERVLVETPQQTLVLIEAADRRFGSAVEARRKLEIEALVRLQRIGLAHAKAERFYRAFPESPSVREIERRTGYHPRPSGPTE